MAKDDSEGWLVILDRQERYMKNVKRKRDRIRFTYLHEGWSESKSANYSATQILGRSEPVKGYMGSSARVINLVLSIPPEGDLFPGASADTAQAVQGFTVTQSKSSPEEFAAGINPHFSADVTKQSQGYFIRKQEVLDFVRSLVYPQYGPQSSVIYPPPRVLIFFGEWFSLVGVVEAWSMTHKGPWDTLTMTPHHTDLNLTVSETDEPYSWNEVFDGVLSKSGFIDKHPSLSSSIG